MKRSIRFAVGIVVCGGIGWAAAQTALKPGEYRVTVEMVMPGQTTPLSLTTPTCITPEVAKDFRSLLSSTMAGPEDCSFTNLVTAGNKIRWDTKCDEVSAKSELTMQGDGFDVLVTAIVAGQTFPSRMSYRWVGAVCSAESLEE